MKTPYDQLPKLVQFDRDCISLSASTINQILETIARDRLGIHRSIINNNLPASQKNLKDEAWAHMLFQICETANRNPERFQKLIQRPSEWRYYFSTIAITQFRSRKKSDWHRNHVRSAESVEYNAEADERIEEVSIIDRHNESRHEWRHFLKNLEHLFRIHHVQWAVFEIWRLKHFDRHKWLDHLGKKRMTYNILHAKTGIPLSTLRTSVQYVNKLIRDHYKATFKEDPPMNLHL